MKMGRVCTEREREKCAWWVSRGRWRVVLVRVIETKIAKPPFCALQPPRACLTTPSLFLTTQPESSYSRLAFPGLMSATVVS